MKIVLNGAWRDLLVQGNEPGGGFRDVLPLDRVLALLGFSEATVATALNGEFVPARARAHTRVRAGDRLEVLAPMQGG